VSETGYEPSPKLIPFFICIFVLVNAIFGSEIFMPLSPWLVNAIEFIFFLITASLLITSRGDLASSNIDKLSFYLFLLFGGVLRSPLNTENLFACSLFYILFLVLSFLLYRRMRSYELDFEPCPRDRFKWIFTGILCGILLSLFASMPFIIENQINGQSPVIMRNLRLRYLFPFIFAMLSALSHGAIFEEPIYRGFTFGYLRAWGVKDNKILILQTILFWAAHIKYINEPFTFWMVVPMSGLMFGWLALQSRSIAPSMVAHAIFNAMRFLY
jgi:membrane protease YdiL (CAAX protease family)